MLTASAIYVMDIESYESLMIVRQQMLDAGAVNAIVEDLTPELEDQLRRELHPEWIYDEDEITEEDFDDTCRITAEDMDITLASEAFDDEWTYTDYLMGN